MGGSHVHGSHAAGDEVDPTGVTRLVLVGLLVVVGVLASLSVWATWPSEDRASSVAYFGEGVTVHQAHVEEVGEPCPVLVVDPTDPDAPNLERPRGCDTLLVTPDDGPDEGTRQRVQAAPEMSRSGLEPGDTVRVYRVPNEGEAPIYAFLGVDRDAPLGILAVFAAAVVIAVARWRGLLAIVGLCFAGAVIWFYMLPALLDGQSGLQVAVGGATVIMFVVLYLAHGVSLRTSVALAGTIFGIVLTAALGTWGSDASRLSGLGGESGDALLLQAGDLDFGQLLVCAVVIAGLGVLNDVTITQSSSVWELRAAGPHVSRRELFASGMRIGRDHIASTIYTIVFAYAGTSLGLLVLVSLYDRPMADLLLDEGVAEEVVRTLASTVGLVLAVPLTTLLAVLCVRGPATPEAAEEA